MVHAIVTHRFMFAFCNLMRSKTARLQLPKALCLGLLTCLFSSTSALVHSNPGLVTKADV